MRIKIFTGIIASFFSILILGLSYIQIFRYDLYKSLSEQNRIRVIPLEAPRGKLYDRAGNILVTSRIAFDIEVIYQEIKDQKTVVGALSRILNVEKPILSEKIKEAKKRPFVPVKIREDVEKEKAIRVEEMMLDLPGVIVTTRPLRKYNYGPILSHLVGYIGRISESELTRYKTYGYQIEDFIGKDGLERSYNDYLRGRDGGFQIEVDSKGRQVRTLAIKEPSPGKDLYLSIDIELQRFCDSLLAEKNGAIVVMDPKTGELLAFVSHANFDPNIFVSSNNFEKVSSLLGDTKFFPLMDRAISGTYPIGSVFKIVVASAGLDSGVFNDKKTFFCKGSFALGGSVFRCWNEKGHGTETVAEGLKNSCNVFFYQLGLAVGPDDISKYAFKFGFGHPTGVDLPGELGGFVPTQSWKRRALKSPWFKGDTANYAIGQGYFLATPIQVLRLIACIGNNGELVRPFAVERIENVELHHVESQKLGLDEGALKVIRVSLRDVVNAPDGTGVYAKSEEVVVAGKTGTAQNPIGQTHAWFAGFAPFENARIALVVFIEHGGKGGLEPARFAKKIVEEAKRLKLL